MLCAYVWIVQPSHPTNSSVVTVWALTEEVRELVRKKNKKTVQLLPVPVAFINGGRITFCFMQLPASIADVHFALMLHMSATNWKIHSRARSNEDTARTVPVDTIRVQ